MRCRDGVSGAHERVVEWQGGGKETRGGEEGGSEQDREMEDQTYRNSQVIAARQLRDLTQVAEARTHDDGLVAVLLVVIEDGLYALDTRIFVRSKGAATFGSLVPVHDTADEGGDQEGSRLGCGDGLGQREHERQVAVDAVLALQVVGGFDTLPRRRDLDEYALLANPNGLVELERGKRSADGADVEAYSAPRRTRKAYGRSGGRETYVDDVQGFVDRCLRVKGEAGIDFGGDLAGDDLENLLSKLHQQAV